MTTNGHATFDNLDDAFEAYVELSRQFAMVCERLEDTTKQNKAIFEICRDNGSALDLLLRERGLSLPEKPEDEDEEA
jgi:predicted O-methyltransferase YrrM